MSVKSFFEDARVAMSGYNSYDMRYDPDQKDNLEVLKYVLLGAPREILHIQVRGKPLIYTAVRFSAVKCFSYLLELGATLECEKGVSILDEIFTSSYNVEILDKLLSIEGLVIEHYHLKYAINRGAECYEKAIRHKSLDSISERHWTDIIYHSARKSPGVFAITEKYLDEKTVAIKILKIGKYKKLIGLLVNNPITYFSNAELVEILEIIRDQYFVRPHYFLYNTGGVKIIQTMIYKGLDPYMQLDTTEDEIDMCAADNTHITNNKPKQRMGILLNYVSTKRTSTLDSSKRSKVILNELVKITDVTNIFQNISDVNRRYVSDFYIIKLFVSHGAKLTMKSYYKVISGITNIQSSYRGDNNNLIKELYQINDLYYENNIEVWGEKTIKILENLQKGLEIANDTKKLVIYNKIIFIIATFLHDIEKRPRLVNLKLIIDRNNRKLIYDVINAAHIYIKTVDRWRKVSCGNMLIYKEKLTKYINTLREKTNQL